VNNIGSVLYSTIVRYAEGGERVVKVVLPDLLFVEFLADIGTTHMMRTLGVEVVAGKVQAPKFFAGESK
jgi:hypothetical protein